MWKRVITFRALGWVELGGKGKFAGVVIFMVAPDVKAPKFSREEHEFCSCARFCARRESQPRNAQGA